MRSPQIHVKVFVAHISNDHMDFLCVFSLADITHHPAYLTECPPPVTTHCPAFLSKCPPPVITHYSLCHYSLVKCSVETRKKKSHSPCKQSPSKQLECQETQQGIYHFKVHYSVSIQSLSLINCCFHRIFKHDHTAAAYPHTKVPASVLQK